MSERVERLSPKDFGRRIEALREGLGLSQVHVERALRLRRGTVSEWEAGGWMPSIRYLADLCSLLRVSADALLHGRLPSWALDEVSSKDRRDMRSQAERERVAAYKRKWHSSKYAERKAAGLCVDCGEFAEGGRVMCRSCADRRKIRALRRAS